MKPECQEYEGHTIELREREGKPEMLLDHVPLRYGQLPGGLYFLHEYAYDWTDNLVELARRFVNYRNQIGKTRQQRESEKGGQ
jgi:hypothetical protein